MGASAIELVRELQHAADAKGDVPTSTEADRHDYGLHSKGVYVKRFGSWNKAVEAAGLPPRPWGGARARTDKAGTGATDLLHALDLRIQRDRAEADVLEQARRYLAEQA